MTAERWMFTLEDALSGISDAPGAVRSFYPLHHGTMKVGAYAPRGTDPQKPHDRDELYIVRSGTGEFVKNGERRRFKPDDVIFVEAGVTHRFENFSDDFVTWVVFWGRTGGET